MKELRLYKHICSEESVASLRTLREGKPLVCNHCQREIGDAPKQTCVHVAGPGWSDVTRHRRFTGKDADYDIICDVCATAGAEPLPLVDLCVDCFTVLDQQFWATDVPLGQPRIRERQTTLSFSHETVRLHGRPGASIAVVQPVASETGPMWIALTQIGELWWLDLEAESCELLFQLPTGNVALDQPLCLHVDRQGRFAAVANTFGLHGLVVDLQAAAVTVSLFRKPYHEEHCIFPLAFCEYEGKSLLVHATEWNRLEVTDPATGQARVDRPVLVYAKPQPEHYLDYFHSELLVSPDQRWIADNGWNWHPVGEVAAWSLADWIGINRWESEDGPSRRELCQRLYFWNGPLCWIDGSTLAVWGFGDDDDFMIPAVRIFDVTTGQEKRWFPGPDGALVYDAFLYSYSPEAGTAVWDVETGEKLLSDPSFCPAAYHSGAHEFLSILDDGSLRRTRLQGKPEK